MFKGFSPELFDFMKGLQKNNSKKWFDRHRKNYEEYLLEPSKDFVLSIKKFFEIANPYIIAEPKFNKSLLRLNKDMRFAKKPYKDYFLIHFGKQKWDSEFYLVINQNDLSVGIFINNEKESDSLFTINIEKYPEIFIDYCKKYSVGRNFDIYELTKMEPVHIGFQVEKHISTLKQYKYFLFRKTYTKDDKNLYTKKFIVEVFKIYNRLYPVYLFATSINLLKDLKEYDQNVGILKFIKKD